MDIVTLWIVTEDASAAKSLNFSDVELDGEVVVISARNWAKGDIPYGKPDAVLFDLRDETAWSHLGAWSRPRRDSDLACIPWIAITTGTIPVESAIEADQTFAGVVRTPLSVASIQRTLSLARHRLMTRGTDCSGESRCLAGSSRVFRTFEPSLFPVIDNLKLAATSDFTILLIAETGTGKSTLAEIIHENSSRHNNRFLAVPCASLPRELIESELFGHVKGAFTGADKTKEGKFDVAKGGTILLDEIDSLEMMQQAKMLRVLETGEFEPVGSNDTRTATARCVVASNVCLEKLVADGKFRQDLFYRLNQLKFEIPPLRKRQRDIIPLTVELVTQCSQENGSKITSLDAAMFDTLLNYQWPGNIRELRNELRRCVLFARDSVVRPDALSPKILAAAAKNCDQASQMHSPTGLAGNVALTEQQTIESMLHNQGFNRAATARALGISRVTLYNKLRRYNIQMKDDDRSM